MTEKDGYNPANRPCPECGGQRVWGKTTGYVSVGLQHKFLFSNEILVPLVCTRCGLTTFYHPKPEKML